MEWIPAPIEDLKEFTALTVRRVLMDLPEFQQAKSSFQKAVTGKELQFPEVGVDFRTVVLHGHTGKFMPQALSAEGLVARVNFEQQQTGQTITVDAYTAWTTYFVGIVDEIPFDLFTYYGDPLAGEKQKRTIPILVPLVENWNINRMAGRGETANVSGTLVMYGTSSPGSKKVLKEEAGKVYNAIRNHGDKFTQAGIKSFLVEPPTYATCTPEEGNGRLLEAQMRFSGLVKLH